MYIKFKLKICVNWLITNSKITYEEVRFTVSLKCSFQIVGALVEDDLWPYLECGLSAYSSRTFFNSYLKFL